MAMIDHLGIKCSRYEEAKQFYIDVLKTLGYSIALDFPGQACGFGPALASDLKEHAACLSPFWLAPCPSDSKPAALHFAFKATSRQQVDDFYAAAIKAGAKDNGAPGIRAQYHPNYYGAFVFDLDGNNIEAVCYDKA